MNLELPEFSMVVLVGASGAGKSTFARQHFLPSEIISSDECRAMVSDDANDQTVTNEAFELVHFWLGKRLGLKRLSVIDATNVQAPSRKPLLQIAKDHDCLPVAIVFDLPESVCIARNQDRDDRNFGHHVIKNHRRNLKKSLKQLKREGFRRVFILKSEEDVANVTITRTKLWNDKTDVSGPFDIIGDIHGCFDELKLLLEKLDYQVEPNEDDPIYRWNVTHPEGRKIVFVGDLVDRGPATPEVLSLAMSVVRDGVGFCVCGNHDSKLQRALQGKNVKRNHGLAESMEQLELESDAFRTQAREFLYGLISHYMFDRAKLCVAHAGLTEKLQGRASGRVRSFAMYGETTGEVDEFGLPVRHDWASEYRGKSMVVYGHTPTPEAEWINNTICLDTGCVFGGELTALRYPERELVSVKAAKVYCEPVRPLVSETQDESRSGQQVLDDVLDLADVQGKRFLHTRLRHKVTIQAEQSAAALEIMSRFAIDPRWLIYIPPTMSPSQTSQREEYLEHPDEALSYYAKNGVSEVICEAKHMGSRAVMVVTRTPEVAMQRFGFSTPKDGVIYTRTGRPFFQDDTIQTALLACVREAMEQGEMWETLETDWICLDCELMPWSAKAKALLKSQYAAVGAATRVALPHASDLLRQAKARGVEIHGLDEQMQERHECAQQFVTAYRQYCWDVESLHDYKIAPFHILATEGSVHTDRDHVWHMETLAKICEADESKILMKTPYLLVDLEDAGSVERAVSWWMEMTGEGGEGMVVKPRKFVAHGPKGLLQPAIKCRGREYLRIIYGPEYTRKPHMDRLRQRGVGRKRSLALREFALGVDALEKFVANAPLRQVHERVFGVLALESDPVDPRL